MSKTSKAKGKLKTARNKLKTARKQVNSPRANKLSRRHIPHSIKKIKSYPKSFKKIA